MENQDEIYKGAGFMDVNGKKEQVGIGEVKKLEDGSLEMEVLVGCSKEALLEIMRKFAKENNKEVRAVFGKGKNREQIVVTPEDVADLD